MGYFMLQWSNIFNYMYHLAELPCCSGKFSTQAYDPNMSAVVSERLCRL